jgi:hypothetical protein
MGVVKQLADEMRDAALGSQLPDGKLRWSSEHLSCLLYGGGMMLEQLEQQMYAEMERRLALERELLSHFNAPLFTAPLAADRDPWSCCCGKVALQPGYPSRIDEQGIVHRRTSCG